MSLNNDIIVGKIVKNKTAKDLWIFTSKNLLFPILIAVALVFYHYFSRTINNEESNHDVMNEVWVAVFNSILPFLWFYLLWYFFCKFNNLIESHEKQVSKIEDKINNSLPKLTSLITSEENFENRLQEVDEIEAPGARWIYSKFISSLLEKSFSSFTIKMSPLEYSDFSSKLFELCQKSIYLTGSMTPSQWLDSLVDTSDTDNINSREDFFNNRLQVEQFEDIISDNNHSLVLRKNSVIKPDQKLRIVCLDEYDWNYLFISERSLDTYYIINSPTDIPYSFFKVYPEREREELLKGGFNPFQYEYALYDECLLLKYDKSGGVLTLISSKENHTEFQAVYHFFVSHINLLHKRKKRSLQGYEEIKEVIRKKKCNIANVIWETKVLPHKLSYLYNGGTKWEEYRKNKTTRYSDLATQAIREGILSLLLGNNTESEGEFNIVELGAGTGDRTARVCGTLGERVKSYQILDISSSLLSQADTRLKKRKFDPLGGKEDVKYSVNLLDCCSNERQDKLKFKTAIDSKDVFILSNSTILAEQGFEWQNLKKARRVFITMDLLLCDSSTCHKSVPCGYFRDVFEDYLAAQDLLLHPLRIFEIPILEEYAKELFFSDYDDSQFVFHVKFKLKEYLKKVDFGDIRPLRSDKDQYIKARKKMKDIEELTVLKSLKFRYYESESNRTINEISSFFRDKGFSTAVSFSIYKELAFAAILLTPR